MIAVVFVKNSTRFPGKHNVVINGKTMVDRVVERIQLSRRIGGVILFAKSPDIRSSLCENKMDTSTGSIGDSLLLAIQTFGEIFAIAGDMPCVSHEVIDEMIAMSNGMSVVPVHQNGTIEPLHSIYNADMAGILHRNLINGKSSLHEFIQPIPHKEYRITDKNFKSFVNVNYPEDLDSLDLNDCK